MSGIADLDADGPLDERMPLGTLSPLADEDPLVTRLREMILSGEFEPGVTVSQVPLAKSLGISTTPLREAMRQLQSEGLLEFSRNRRARVPRLDVDDLHAVYAARVLLEAHGVAMTAASAGLELRERVRAELQQMDEAVAGDDLEEWTRLHALFHLDLVSGATPQLMPTIRNFFDRAERYRRLARVSARPRTWLNPRDEHRMIVDAFVDGDASAAAQALATHLARTAIQLSADFAPEIDPTPVRVAVGLITESRSSTVGGGTAALGRSRRSGAGGGAAAADTSI